MTNKNQRPRKLRNAALGLCLLSASVGAITVMSSFVGDNETGGGSCWKTEQVICNGTTTTTVNGVTTQTTVTGGKISAQVTGGTASNTNVGNTLNLVVKWDAPSNQWVTTTPGGSTVTVGSWRADCSSGGNMGCQATDCDKKSMDYKPCNS